MPLPKPQGRQREVLYLPTEGHFAIAGTAGSGKTTIATLRAAYLADKRLDHAGPTLLVTFNRTLAKYLEFIREGGGDQVTIENYHTFARGYLNSRGKMAWNVICDGNVRTGLIASAVQVVRAADGDRPLLRRSVDLFASEMDWIRQRGIGTLAEYEAVERIGRADARVSRRDRGLVWEVYETYNERRRKAGKMYDWDDLAPMVIDEFALDTSARRYRHIVVDEGQDLGPLAIRSLATAIPSNGSLTIFTDSAQQLYGRRVSWSSAGLKVKQVWKFENNYRNSHEIARLALAISRMPYYRDVEDMVAPVPPIAAGPTPALVSCASPDVEVATILEQARAISATQTVAILTQDRGPELKRLRARLPRSILLHKDMANWSAAPGVYVGTYYAAKGLEFDAVILPFLSNTRFPDPDDIAAFGDEDAAAQHGKLLYVGVTRARRVVIMTHTGDPTALLPTEAGLYLREERR